MTTVQHTLFNYSQTPPAAAWDNIAAVLDDTPAYVQKLQAFEQAPPAAAWQNIQQQLAVPQAKVVPLRTQLFKYAIAAVVLGVIAAGSMLYLKSGLTPGANTAKNGTPHQSKNTFLNEQGLTADQHNDEINRTNGTALPVSGRPVVYISPQVHLGKKSLAANEVPLNSEEKTFVDTRLSDRYMIATTATGKVVRLPKKAYSDYACAESYKNLGCKQRIASIQSKMAATVSTDFTDFMDLLKQLQEVQ